MHYTGTPIWQDVASPCVTLPEVLPAVFALPLSSIGGKRMEQAFIWAGLQRGFEECGFRLWSDGTLEVIGD
jgi:hypothetical protein